MLLLICNKPGLHKPSSHDTVPAQQVTPVCLTTLAAVACFLPRTLSTLKKRWCWSLFFHTKCRFLLLRELLRSWLIESKGNSEKIKIQIWCVLQDIQKYCCSLFNEASNSICLLTGLGTYCSLASIGVKELYRYHIITVHTGLPPLITIHQRFLTGYKKICVLSALCQDTLKENGWQRRCQTVILLNNLKQNVTVNYILKDWKHTHICKQIVHSGFVSKTAPGFLLVRDKSQSEESCITTFCKTQKQNSREKNLNHLQHHCSMGFFLCVCFYFPDSFSHGKAEAPAMCHKNINKNSLIYIL